MSFVHLRLHSEFSLVDGIVRLKPLLKAVAEQEMPAVAVCDQAFLSCLVKFYNGAIGSGIQPVLAVDFWIENPDDLTKPYRMPAIALNTVGYRNLTEILSKGYQHNQINDKCLIKQEWLLEQNEGIILLSGANYGDVGHSLIAGRIDEAQQQLQTWLNAFGDRYYLELHRTQRAGDELHISRAVELAKALKVPVVATNDVVFMEESDFDAHEARVCINEGVALDDPRRSHRYSNQQYFKSAEQMQELFADIPQAIENSLLIAKRCSSQVHLGEYFLPNYPVPDGLTMDQFFRQLSKDGLDNRLIHILDKNDPDYAEKRKVYDDRLTFELDIILQMGFPGYFLIVMDFIRWGKENGVPIGPGRGSGAGSLVAYVLDITDLDPLQYDLLFERFLNPERVSMPDFDIDFCMDGRDKVIQYVADHYGRDAVSQIITFGTMAAKAVVRDVARVQGKSYGLADKLSKLIPFEVGMTLTKAWETTAELVEFVEGDEEAQEIWDMAKKLEGITRNVGKHAGGVVIAPTKLTDFSPLYCDADGSGLVTQFDKNDVESAGLVKFDFLGLRTLTIVDWALKTVNSKLPPGEEPIDIAHIPLDDEASFALLKRAETTAVFQLESRGMKDLVKRLQPDNLEDMIALVALFRPGPLESGMVDDFINRKHGREKVAYPHVDFQHERLQPILEPTYGVIVYQEQVMQIAQALAGYSLGGADMLRRAMGKKKPEEMAKQRSTFEEGAASEGIDPKLAIKIFDLVEKFAGYGFNKSHSAAYALVAYQTLWLKTHHPAAFMAANMSADMQNTEKVVILIEECREMGLPVTPPDVNQGEYMFTVNDENQVIYGLGAVKGVGEGPVEAIVEARNAGGPFTDLFDFCKRCESKKINKRVIDALVKSGALDNIGPTRAIMLASMEDALKAAAQASSNQDAGMFDMFGMLEAEDEVDVYENFKNIHDWTLKERLKGEKDTLGLFLTGHPIDEYEAEVKRMTTCRLGKLEASKQTQTLAGLVLGVRTMKTKRGSTIGFINLDDRTGRTEVSIFGEQFDEIKHLLVVDEVIVIEGEVSWDDYSEANKVKAKQVYTLAQARHRLVKGLQIKADANVDEQELSKKLNQLVPVKVPQGAYLELEVTNKTAQANVRLSEDYQFNLDDETLTLMRRLFGEAEFIYH